MKIKWSGLGMTDGSGKIGGNVAAKNRFGSYLRRKGQVLNPQTASQLAVRGIFGAFSSAWYMLSDAAREGWRSLAATVTNTDQFGDSFNPTGFNLYKRCNQNLSAADQASITDAPALESGPEDISLTTVAPKLEITATTVTGVTLATTNAALNAGSLVPIIQATPSVSPGRTAGSIKNLFRQIVPQGGVSWPVIAPGATDTIAPGDAEWDDFYTAYVAKFGVPTVGNRVFVRLKFVDDTTGQAFLTYAFDLVVAA